MNETNVIERESLAGNVAIYQAMFENYLREHVQANGLTDPEITGPILAAYKVGPRPCVMSAMITAFVAGVNAGIALVMGLDEKEISNQTIIE